MHKMSIIRVQGYNATMLKNNLSKLMGEKRMKMSELEKISGLSQGTIIKLYYDRTKGIEFHTLERLCYALECTPNDIFEYIEP